MPNKNAEIWRPYKNTNYLISNYGRIYNKKTDKYLAANPSSSGYLKVNLHHKGTVKTVSVSRLVAALFIERPKFKNWVHHIDGNILNNKVSNLMWVSGVDNKYFEKTGIEPEKSNLPF
ncbi:MAG: hypothetical protein EHM58_04415 [Ignavibacteriae bacterium]|nr:MAG: hypothetical protein EHM58_04415 [Ignavibacteriota bacterium]